MLRIVDKFETEKSVLARELSSTSRSLAEEKAKNSRLKTENVRQVHVTGHPSNATKIFLQERYRNDVNLTIQLLQCKPGNFMPQKFDSVR